MNVTKAKLIDHLYRSCGFSKEESSTTIESVFEAIKGTLESGEDVLISGFGKFCLKEKKERKGRNPETGDAMILDARRIVTFKCSGVLRDRINGKE